jgi:hypothetical protein
LVVNGQIEGLSEVLGGTLGGTGTLGSLLVQAEGRVSPGQSIGTLSVTGPLTLYGSLVAEVGGTGADRISAAGPVALEDGVLVASAPTSLTTGGGALQIGQTVRTLISAASITGTFSVVPLAGQHLGHGVFVRDHSGADSSVRYNETSVEIALLQASPGDINGDRQFNQLDVIQMLQGPKFLSGQPATWLEGDFTGDALFNQLDLVAALQTGTYLQGPYAVLAGR